MRPHEALGMLTPAMRWQPSARRYDANPSRWQYPEGAWVLKIDCSGKLDIGGRKWKISQALAGEYVHILPIEERLLVYYCTTLMRELDLDTQRSTIVDRWLQQGSGTG